MEQKNLTNLTTRLDETNECCLEGGPPLPLAIPEVTVPPPDVLGAMTVTPDTESGVFLPARNKFLLSG